MTAKESKAAAWRIGVGFGAIVTEDAKLAARFVKDGYNVTPLVEESALHAAEAERDALQSRLDAVAGLADNWYAGDGYETGNPRIDEATNNRWSAKQECATELRAALGCATTGEGE